MNARLLALLFVVSFAGAAAATGAAPAAPPATALRRDLGRSLMYYRLVDLPRDLPPADSPRQQPCVLDVRYAAGDAAAAASLLAWLRQNATARTPVFVLANGETSAPLIAMLGSRRDVSHVIVLGRAAPGFAPDLPLESTAEEERRAYDALAGLADVTALITTNPGKPRNDEASLSRDSSTEPRAGGRPPPAANGPIDAALQRAVHLHRALLALRKL